MLEKWKKRRKAYTFPPFTQSTRKKDRREEGDQDLITYYSVVQIYKHLLCLCHFVTNEIIHLEGEIMESISIHKHCTKSEGSYKEQKIVYGKGKLILSSEYQSVMQAIMLLNLFPSRQQVHFISASVRSPKVNPITQDKKMQKKENKEFYGLECKKNF